MLVAQGSEHSIMDYVQSNLKDFSVTARVLSVDQRELKKIKKDYAQNYTFDKSQVYFKDPFKLRVDSTIEDTTVSLTYNEFKMKIKAPGVSSRQDLTQEPLRRETVMDFGVLVPSLFQGCYNARFVRVDRETGHPVFDITFVDKSEGARYRIWIDPVHKVLTKREWYNRYGSQLATFYYENPKESNGVWIPSKISVWNVDNKMGGATSYDSIKVNSGLADTLFNTR